MVCALNAGSQQAAVVTAKLVSSPNGIIRHELKTKFSNIMEENALVVIWRLLSFSLWTILMVVVINTGRR
jgi:hypothetical protein